MTGDKDYYETYSRLVIILIFGFMMIGFVSGARVDYGVRVIVLNKNNMVSNFGNMMVNSNIEIPKDRINHRYSSVNGFSVNVTSDELKKLELDSSKKVFVDKIYNVNLDVSVPLINANDVWNLNYNSTNITGKSQTVCVIDTGVNYSHAAFGNCYGYNNVSSNCTVIGGYDFVNGDDDPMDDNGHGTHVSGIIASRNLTYRGVAPGVKIIAIKAMDSTGNGKGSDIVAGIDWCVNNASKFNISVISMSLGDNSTHSTYCNDNYFASFINNAVAHNISVVVSAGNCNVGNQTCTDGVSAPACVESAIIAGAVDDVDNIYYMRGALLELMAPGINIISSIIGGGFGSMSGTSMSAPHIAGAIALMDQYLDASGQIKTPNEIEDILNDTGVVLDDSLGSGYNFSRIDVYSALLSLDMDAPNVTLVSPVNNHVNLSSNQSFVCNATDWQLVNVTFRIWNSSTLYYNETRNLTGTENNTSFDLENMGEGDYVWNCEVMDLRGNSGEAVSNFSLTVGGVNVILDSPANGSVTNINETNFSCSAQSDSSYSLINMSFNFWNSSGFLINNQSLNISGIENSTNFNYTFLAEGSYIWECVALNNNSNVGYGTNFSIRYDATAPVISGVGVSKTTTSAIIYWTTNESSNSSVWVSGGSWSNSSNFATSHSILVSSLSASSDYNYIITSCDEGSNCINDSGNFITNVLPISSGGGGGGGGGGFVIHSIKDDDLRKGVNKIMTKKDKVKFILASGSHELSVSKVGKDFAEVTLRSDPIVVNLSIGEEMKFNLSSPDYYDLYVRLNNINYRRANFSIMRIFEDIPKKDKTIFHITENKTREGVVEVIEKKNDDVWVGLLIVILIVLFLYAKKFKDRNIKKKKKK